MDCRACGSTDQVPLPDPHPACAVVSDGRLVPVPLGKVSCKTCGLVSTQRRRDARGVRSHYDASYDLNLVDSAADRARARRYADLIRQLWRHGEPQRVLEVGCGSGAVLRALAADWTAATFEGIEAAPALAALPVDDTRISKRQGFAEDLQPRTPGHDLVFAINVVEHAWDPVSFLQSLSGQLTTQGEVILVCPSGSLPNLELLFADHLHTFTANAFAALARQAGLAVVTHQDRPDGLGDFQVFVLTKPPAERHIDHPAQLGAEMAKTRSDYLAAWASLDGCLAERLAIDSPVVVFGAGEATCLLRAYAPKTWQRIEGIWVDDPASARQLGRPIFAYAGTLPRAERRVLVATHPSAQASVASRLERDGHSVAIWSDLIER